MVKALSIFYYFILIFSAFKYLCVGMRACMCLRITCVPVCVSAYERASMGVWRPEGQPGMCSSGASLHPLWNGFSHWHGTFGKAPGMHLPLSPRHLNWKNPLPHLVLTRILGIELRYKYSCSKHFTDWAVSPALSECLNHSKFILLKKVRWGLKYVQFPWAPEITMPLLDKSPFLHGYEMLTG